MLGFWLSSTFFGTHHYPWILLPKWVFSNRNHGWCGTYYWALFTLCLLSFMFKMFLYLNNSFHRVSVLAGLNCSLRCFTLANTCVWAIIFNETDHDLHQRATLTETLQDVLEGCLYCIVLYRCCSFSWCFLALLWLPFLIVKYIPIAVISNSLSIFNISRISWVFIQYLPLVVCSFWLGKDVQLNVFFFFFLVN